MSERSTVEPGIPINKYLSSICSSLEDKRKPSESSVFSSISKYIVVVVQPLYPLDGTEHVGNGVKFSMVISFSFCIFFIKSNVQITTKY